MPTTALLSPRRVAPVEGRVRHARHAPLFCAAAASKPAGFGGTPPPPPQQPQAPQTPQTGGYWNALKTTLPAVSALPKARLPLIFGSRSVIVWAAGGAAYCTAAVSPPWQFPLVDAAVFLTAEGKHAIRSPLDGCAFDLATGAVIEWCPPESSPLSLRNFLNMAKKGAKREPLVVYDIRVGPGGELAAFFPVV